MFWMDSNVSKVVLIFISYARTALSEAPTVAPCSPGLYGPACSSLCGHCFGIACERTTGHCLFGCSRGYTNEDILCKTPCDAGYYGLRCSDLCGNCSAGTTCNVTTGRCPSGCSTGYLSTDPFCNTFTECSPGLYGRACSFTCGKCIGLVCERTSGTCPNGCVEGFNNTDSFCRTRNAPSENIETGSSQKLLYAILGGVAGASAILLVNVVIIAIKCRRRTPRVKNNDDYESPNQTVHVSTNDNNTYETIPPT